MINLKYSLPENGNLCIDLKTETARVAELYQQILQGEAQYDDSLGWLNPAACAGPDTPQYIQQLADQIRSSCQAFVVVGVGGSNQAARGIIQALNKSGGPEILYAGNTISSPAMAGVLKALEGKDFCINVIAKNFETLEPGVSFRILRHELEKRYGEAAKDRIFVTGTQGSALHAIAQNKGYRFLHFPQPVGGRFSAFSSVGLLPMAVAGISIEKLLQGASALRSELLEGKPEQSPVVTYALLRNQLLSQGYGVEQLCFFEPSLYYLSRWWTQLFGESEGKDNRGLFPVSAQYSEDLHSIGQFVQQGSPLLFETFLKVEDTESNLPLPPSSFADGFEYLQSLGLDQINKIAEAATIEAHLKRLPVVEITLPRLEEETLGQLLYFFEISCYLSARILGVNPFDQPGVEAYKQSMFAQLGKP